MWQEMGVLMAKNRMHKDIIIIGAGMAGLTAALYAGRAKLDVLVLEDGLVGGQIANATGIENYPGFMTVSGKELIGTLQNQAENVGAVVDEFDKIEHVVLKAQPKIVETESAVYEADAVILATGMNRRQLPLPEAARYNNKGVHYCELCDGHLYQDKIIVVMGGGNAAVDAANYLSKYARKLYLIHRSAFRADKASVDKLLANEKIEVLLNTEIQALLGDERLEKIKIFDKETKEERELAVDAIFVNIGVVPNIKLFEGEIALGSAGRIAAGEDTRTNIEGVYAAGDIREKEVRQLTTAAADGTTAAILAEKYMQRLRAARAKRL